MCSLNRWVSPHDCLAKRQHLSSVVSMLMPGEGRPSIVFSSVEAFAREVSVSARPVEDGLISKDRNRVLPADLYSQRCSSYTCGTSPGPHAIAVLPPSTKRCAIDPTVVCPVVAVIVPTTPSPAVGMIGPIIALLSRIMHLPSSSVRLELVPWLVHHDCVLFDEFVHGDWSDRQRHLQK